MPVKWGLLVAVLVRYFPQGLIWWNPKALTLSWQCLVVLSLCPLAASPSPMGNMWDHKEGKQKNSGKSVWSVIIFTWGYFWKLLLTGLWTAAFKEQLSLPYFLWRLHCGALFWDTIQFHSLFSVCSLKLINRRVLVCWNSGGLWVPVLWWLKENLEKELCRRLGGVWNCCKNKQASVS